MENIKKAKQSEDLKNLPFIFRASELEEYGIPRSRLSSYLQQGEIERIERGLYRKCDAESTEYESILLVSKKVPRSIVCLLTALQVHEIGTQMPRDVWIAIDREDRLPRFRSLPVRIVRFSGQMLQYGIESRTVQGVTFQITSPARTVVDCFRYRNKIGLDVALEALEDSLRSRRVTVSEIMRSAEVCRIGTVVKPYIETLAS